MCDPTLQPYDPLLAQLIVNADSERQVAEMCTETNDSELCAELNQSSELSEPQRDGN